MLEHGRVSIQVRRELLYAVRKLITGRTNGSWSMVCWYATFAGPMLQLRSLGLVP